MPSKPLTAEELGKWIAHCRGLERCSLAVTEFLRIVEMARRGGETERQYRELAAGVCLDLQGAHAVPAGYHTHGDAILARHERERKEAPDAQAAP